MLRCWSCSLPTNVLRGDIQTSLDGFRKTLELQRIAERHLPERPLWGTRGIEFAKLQDRLGRHVEAKNVNDANESVLRARRQSVQDDADMQEVKLVHAFVALSSGRVEKAIEIAEECRDWAINKNAQELLCNSLLVEARAQRLSIDLNNGAPRDVERLKSAVELGSSIARDFGFGLLHIDFLLESARLHLIEGDSDAAKTIVEIALHSGLEANPSTGQMEMLSASDLRCGYAWAIAIGLQLKAEAVLLQAARMIGSRTWRPCLECGKTLEGSDRDRTSCHACRSRAGKLSDLYVAINADGDDPDRIPQWKAIRHHLRERFGHSLANRELWQRLSDWLEADFQLLPGDYLRLNLDDVTEFLRMGKAEILDAVRDTDQRLHIRSLLFQQASQLVDEAKSYGLFLKQRWLTTPNSSRGWQFVAGILSRIQSDR